ncbi:proteinase-activated receptor 2 [Xenopus laevis]|uniref:Proteinase-activated receptor 2 n=1 Tax=Xenopus laevis TaxID=8355 RepID=A0A8J0U2P7_XENLA|nr:proteinase-activated receptor 2 [Xenopus laevis]
MEETPLYVEMETTEEYNFYQEEFERTFWDPPSTATTGQNLSQVLSDPLNTAFLPAVYIIVFIIGLPSNGIALWVFFFRTKKKNPAMIYMANLALADLMFVIWLPLKIAYHLNGNNWIYGEALCKVLIVFFYGNMYCSILFMTCLSVQRYWAIVKPMSHTRKNTKLAFIVSIAIWVVIMLGTIPLYLIDLTYYWPHLGITTCYEVLPPNEINFDLFKYVFAIGIVAFFLPAIITAVVYTLMIKTLTASITDESIGKKRKRAIRLIIIVLVMYLVCFLPSNLLLVIHYGSQVKLSNSLYTAYIWALCPSSLNSSIDPFVYYFVSKDFRDHVKNMFLCRSVRTVERMRI